MNVLVLGSGGREHAFAWKIARSSQIDKLFIAPGNAGTAQEGTNVDLAVDDFDGIKAFCLAEKIDSVLVGPEVPLVLGIADYFEADSEISHIAIIGPNKAAAQLEGSKDFSKRFMKKYNIPTAKYATFTKDTIEEGYKFLETLKPPYVLKADGLAAGKGVLILPTIEEAKLELKDMLEDAKFGDASSRVVIEEFLKGIELSVFIVTDGQSYKKLPEAKDYKRIGEGDTGLNTGGMGAVSPVPFATQGFMDKIENQIIIPTVKGLKKEGIDYRGFIFFGIINVKNDPYVIEYNCRMGDPETEVVIPRLKSDIIELFEGVATQTLSERDVEFDSRSAATVMMVSGGYPDAYEKEKTVTGINSIHDSLVFHSGTKKDGPTVLSAGGRVLCVTSYGKNIEKALELSYNNIGKISFDKAYYRKDIGFDVVDESK
ncbi:phosphoribosylamine--glycine ligase [Crocinitomix catalasitica]|uniref:phosphoribosylamine--glycine ligase n=1 Tax=Crocinitomix catalasitica TaxID=184607 RepID=UPI00047FE2CA|nr:phosphoribosylamine--glycine ligase [Crocinitomix catalasitica]